MSLTLTVDGERWRAHLRSVAERQPGMVPVAKGNGYGFGLGRLARKAQWLRDPATASTCWRSAPTTSSPRSPTRFAGDLLVLTPWRPSPTRARRRRSPRRVIHTVSRLADLAQLLEPRTRTRGSCSSS